MIKKIKVKKAILALIIINVFFIGIYFLYKQGYFYFFLNILKFYIKKEKSQTIKKIKHKSQKSVNFTKKNNPHSYIIRSPKLATTLYHQVTQKKTNTVNNRLFNNEYYIQRDHIAPNGRLRRLDSATSIHIAIQDIFNQR